MNSLLREANMWGEEYVNLLGYTMHSKVSMSTLKHLQTLGTNNKNVWFSGNVHLQG
jgi:hypothetical protein